MSLLVGVRIRGNLANLSTLCSSNQVQAIYAALSNCAALHPSADETAPSGVFADSENDPDWAELLRQANANGANGGAGDGEETELTEAGRVRGDFVTPSARHNPY